jgi:hypothetical protein
MSDLEFLVSPMSSKQPCPPWLKHQYIPDTTLAISQFSSIDAEQYHANCTETKESADKK